MNTFALPGTMGGGIRTTMYKQSLSEKLVIIAAINGCPETAARICRSQRIWAICFLSTTAARFHSRR